MIVMYQSRGFLCPEPAVSLSRQSPETQVYCHGTLEWFLLQELIIIDCGQQVTAYFAIYFLIMSESHAFKF